FCFDERLRSLETTFFEYRQTNPFIDAVSAIPADLSEMELKKILIEKIEGNKSIQRSDEQQNLYKALVEAYDADKTILDTYGESNILKRRREDDDQEGPSAESDRGSTTGSQSRQLSASESAFAEEPVQTTCQMEEPSHPVFETGADNQPIVQTSEHPEWFSQPRRPPSPDHRGSKRQREGGEHASASTPSETATGSAGRSTIVSQSRQLSASESAFAEEPVQITCQMEEPSHPPRRPPSSDRDWNKTLVATLTLELLAGPAYELMRGSCNSLTELEYHLEEVYKATTDQLDWVNPEGQQYLHNLLQPLPLISDNEGRRVIPFEHFINNDLEYLRGGADKLRQARPLGSFSLGRKHQQFYGFAVNRESTLDVYSKRRIIAVTELKIVEWHNYKHLDWISVRRDDDQIYKFKEGDFKRLLLQDIEDMLLLLVQGKLSNLTVEERFSFNVSLRMFTRSIVIQRRVEDLQLGVKSYQKRLNLTKPNTYRTVRNKMHKAFPLPGESSHW
nr:hypothetical protein [Tanacetum cinerariifolium]